MTQEVLDQAIIFKNQITYLIGELGFKILCTKDNFGYTSKTFQEFEELIYVLEYFDTSEFETFEDQNILQLIDFFEARYNFNDIPYIVYPLRNTIISNNEIVPITIHNLLSGLQGGALGEYYHLTLDEYDAVQNSLNPNGSNPFLTTNDANGKYYPLNSNPANYLIESDLSRSNWDEAYSWGDHALVGYALESQLHDPVTLGTANGLSLNNQQLSLGLSSTNTTGALSSTDWNTFNNKYNQPTGLTTQYIRGDGSLATLNTTVVPEGTNLYFTQSRARTSISLTTTGNSGASTYNNSTGVFNIPNYTLAGLGGEPAFSKGDLIQGSDISLTGNLIGRLVGSGDVTIDVNSVPWSKITNTPTTLAGYNINDAYTITEVDNLLSGYVTIATTQTITGLKTIQRSGDVLKFGIGADNLYGLKVFYSQNELAPTGEATWSIVNTFNRNNDGFSVTPISFFRGVLITGERLPSSNFNSNLLAYYNSNPTGRYPVYSYKNGVQQFTDKIIVGESNGVVNNSTGAIADLPTGVVGNFKGRVIGANAVNSNEFVTLTQLSDYVPYTGATQNVSLGNFGVSTNHVVFSNNPTNIPTTQGTTYWDVDNKTLATVLNGYTMRIGEDIFYPVQNNTGTLIPKGTAVQFAGTVGMSGRLLIAPFIANGTVPSTFFMGVTAENIANGAEGKVLWFGKLRGVNTDAFNEGDVLYASTTTPGGFQTTVPQAPNNIIQIAAVISKHPNVGQLFIRPTIGSNINKDEGVKITSLQTGDILQVQANGLFENRTKAQYLGGTSSQFVKGDGSLDSNVYQLLSEKSQPNGYTPLDANGKVPLIHINDAILGQVRYIGTWNAATNTPTLPDPTTVKGNYYVATNSGTQFGKDFNTGDWVISDGVIWDKVDNTDAVATVFGRIGNILAVESDYQAFYPRLSQTYANPTWISSLAWSKITGTPTTLSGYGITDAVPSNRTITINGTTQDLSANRTWNVGTLTSVNLGYTAAASNGTVTNTAGTNATIPAATTSLAGLLTSADKTKLDGIATNANNYVHPTYTAVSQTLSGATVLASFSSDTIGSVTGFTTRTLTLANLGYTGATNADNYGSWSLAAGGVAGTQSITSGATATFSATSPITVSRATGTITYAHANSGVSAGTYRSVTVNATGHVTGGTNPTTLAGYGITDAYTQTQINNFFSGATAITGYNKSNWDTAFGWGNHALAGYALSNGSNASGTWGINITGNAGTATVLQNARNFTIGNTVRSFNGSSNLSWTHSDIGVIRTREFGSTAGAIRFIKLGELNTVINTGFSVLRFEISGAINFGTTTSGGNKEIVTCTTRGNSMNVIVTRIGHISSRFEYGIVVNSTTGRSELWVKVGIFNIPTSISVTGSSNSTDVLTNDYTSTEPAGINYTNNISYRTVWDSGNLPNPVQGTGVAGRVAFWNGTGSISSDGGFLWNSTSKSLSLLGTDSNTTLIIGHETRTQGKYRFRTGGAQAERLSIESSIDNGANFNENIRIEINNINFSTQNTIRWSILSNGILQSNGLQTIQTSTGNLTLATGGGNGNILLSPNGSGALGVKTTDLTGVNNLRSLTLNGPNNSINFRIDNEGSVSSGGNITNLFVRGDSAGTGFTSTIVTNIYGEVRKNNDILLDMYGDRGADNVFKLLGDGMLFLKGNVGIGTTNPEALLQSGNNSIQNISENSKIIIAHGASMEASSAGHPDIPRSGDSLVPSVGLQFDRYWQGSNSGNRNMGGIYGYGVQNWGSGIFFSTRPTGSGGTPVVRMVINHLGNLLIGTTGLTGGGRLQVSGDGRFTGDVIAFSSSDKRLKDNITKIDNSLEKITKLGGYSYEWNKLQSTYTGTDYGVIAQEVEALFPEMVQTRDNGYKAVKYDRLIPVMIEAIKELKDKIDKLENK